MSYGDHDIRFEERKKPELIDPTDAIIKMTKTTICGTDLGIYKGKKILKLNKKNKKNGSFNGRILGHEGIGIVEQIGSSVKNIKVGDKVIVSCVSRCGTCENCAKQLYSHCRNDGGWIMGYMIDGTQASSMYVLLLLILHYMLPEGLNEDVAVLLSDALPTAHEIGVQNGDIKPGDTVAIVGAGPAWYDALLTAQFYSPSQIIMIAYDEKPLSYGKRVRSNGYN